MVRRADIASAVAEGRGATHLRELIDGVDPDGTDDDAVPHVHPDHPLGLALARMGATRHTVLPVVSRANVRAMLGVVTLSDILNSYGVSSVADVPSRRGVENG